MTDAEGKDPDTMAIADENQNTKEGCVRDDCSKHTCKATRVCVPMWEFYECE